MEEMEYIQCRLDLNHHCEEKLMKFLKEDGKDEHFGNVSLECFSRCNIQELQSFILMRYPGLQKSMLPKKGKLVDATSGEDNLIKLAFDLRCHGRKLDGVLNSMNLIDNTYSHDSMSRENITIHSSTRILDTKRVSEMLGNGTWIDKVWRCFHTLSTLHSFPIVTEELKDQADILQKKLVHCLHMHLPTRLDDENKMDSWCWKWSERNFGIIAAIMLLLGHIKEDFECFDRTYTLLED